MSRVIGMELLGERPAWSMSGAEVLSTLDQVDARRAIKRSGADRRAVRRAGVDRLPACLVNGCRQQYICGSSPWRLQVLLRWTAPRAVGWHCGSRPVVGSQRLCVRRAQPATTAWKSQATPADRAARTGSTTHEGCPFVTTRCAVVCDHARTVRLRPASAVRLSTRVGKSVCRRARAVRRRSRVGESAGGLVDGLTGAQ